MKKIRDVKEHSFTLIELLVIIAMGSPALNQPIGFLRMLAEKAQHSLHWSILQIRSRKMRVEADLKSTCFY